MVENGLSYNVYVHYKSRSRPVELGENAVVCMASFYRQTVVFHSFWHYKLKIVNKCLF